MPNPIDSPEYWIEDFEPRSAELEALSARMLESMQPASIESLAASLVRERCEQALQSRSAAAASDGALYAPTNRYEVGQKVVFAALDGAAAKVKSVRPGNNPAYGDYEVLKVTLGGEVREFAAGLSVPHALNAEENDIDPDDLTERYASVVAPKLREHLQRESEWVSIGDRWMLKALLPEVNAGHLNLAEAIIMLAGEAVPTSQLLEEIELDPSASADARGMALELGLGADARFRNVGAYESPLWGLATQS